MVGVDGPHEGVLVRNAEALEPGEGDTSRGQNGTLTEGPPRLNENVTVPGCKSRNLQLAASLEQASEHPLASAIIAGCKERISLWKSEQFESVMRGSRAGPRRKVLIGTLASCLEKELACGVLEASSSAPGERPNVYRAADANDNRIDRRGRSRQATTPSPSSNCTNWLESGELTATATTETRCRTTKNDEFTPIGPRQKQKQSTLAGIVAHRRHGGRWINDAALAREQCIAWHWTDVAIASAGITLVRAICRGVVRAIQLSKAVMRNILKTHIRFRLQRAGCPLPQASSIDVWDLLSPIIASAAMSFSSVSVDKQRLAPAPRKGDG